MQDMFTVCTDLLPCPEDMVLKGILRRRMLRVVLMLTSDCRPHSPLAAFFLLGGGVFAEKIQRGQFGEERYEKEEFQRTVRSTFLSLMEEDKVCENLFIFSIFSRV